MTNTLPAGISIKELVRYVKLNDQATKTKKLRDALNDKIKIAFSAFPVGKAFIFENIQVKMGQQMRFDPEAFAAKYPFEKFPQFYTHAIDPKLVPDTLKTDKFKKPVLTLGVTEVEVVTVQAEINVEQAAA